MLNEKVSSDNPNQICSKRRCCFYVLTLLALRTNFKFLLMNWTWVGWHWTTKVNVAENCPATCESISISTRGMYSSSVTLSLFYKIGLGLFLNIKISHLLHLIIALRRSEFTAWLTTELSWVWKQSSPFGFWCRARHPDGFMGNLAQTSSRKGKGWDV